jgi:hypothetical protein
MRNPQRHALRRPRVGPFPKLSEIRCFYSFSRLWRAHRACRCRFRGWHDGPMGGGDGGTNGCAVGGEALGVSGPQKPKFSSILGRETAQKRLRNGHRNGLVSAKGTASAFPRGNQRSWGVALPSDQASRRSSPARAMVPRGPFPPTLYLLKCRSC